LAAFPPLNLSFFLSDQQFYQDSWTPLNTGGYLSRLSKSWDFLKKLLLTFESALTWLSPGNGGLARLTKFKFSPEGI
jgi:hypothetical protein